MGEKTETLKWVMFVVGVLFVVAVLIIGWRWVTMPINKQIERKVLVESHQYKQGMGERVAMFEAALAEVNAKLSLNTNPTIRRDLEAQRTTINAQLRAARRVQ